MTQAPQCLSLGSYDNTPQTHSEEFLPFLEVERSRTKLLGEDSHPALRWQLCPVCPHLVGSRVQGKYHLFLPSHEQLYSPDIITQGFPTPNTIMLGVKSSTCMFERSIQSTVPGTRGTRM